MEYAIGSCASFTKTISESDIYIYAGICGDFNPLHVNKEYAQKTSWGKTVAHGLLCGSLISTVLGMYIPGPGTVYLEQTLKFKAPVYIGDTITATAVITELFPKAKAKLYTTVTNQEGTIVIEGEAIVKLPAST